MNRKTIFGALAICAVGLLIYANSMRNSFVYDDHVLIGENNFIKDWRNFPRIFSRDYFRLTYEATYRPVCTLTFFTDYSLWKLNVFGWHLTNILFHIANAVLIYFLLHRFFSDSSTSSLNLSLTPLLTALIFLLHPVQSEAVGVPSFREDLICFFFFLLSFYLYLCSTMPLFQHSTGRPSEHSTIPRFHYSTYIASCISFLLALFSKEMAITLPFVLLLYGFCFPRQKEKTTLIPKSTLPYFLIAFVFLVARLTILQPVGFIRGVITLDMFPGTRQELVSRILTMSKVVLDYLRLTFFPFRLSIHYIISPVRTITEPTVLVSLIILALILWFAIKVRRDSPIVTFSILFFFVVLLPVANVIPFWLIEQERYLYFSLFGFSFLLSFAFVKAREKIPKNSKRFLSFLWLFCLLGVLVFYSWRTMRRNLDWKDDISIWSKVLKDYPRSKKAHFLLGDAYFKKGDLEKASFHYAKVLEEKREKNEEISTHRTVVHSNLGLISMEKEDYLQAIKHFEEGLKINPDSPLLHNNLGIAYFRLEKKEKAIAEFEKAIKIDPYFENSYFNLSKVYLSQGKYPESVKTLERLRLVDPENLMLKKVSTHLPKLR